MVSSRFSTVMSCGTLCIINHGFVSFGTVSSRFSRHLSLIEVLSKLIYSEVPGSMSTRPSFNNLKDLTPTFITLGLTFVFVAF
jgi:hypothetical protein